ncbi:MAG: excinuclease ABC subunit UvrC [Candidatus Eisenbacteria bacterium]|nr:excinuclease ABC subunit UvrC [Candidatus Eisenbacteria bacterium]
MARKKQEPAVPKPPQRRPEEESAVPGFVHEPVPDYTPAIPGPPDWRALIEQRLRLLPAESGVYLFRDARGRVLYVGKAKRLTSRVRSYFRGPEPDDPRLGGLRRRIRNLDYVVTRSESEALILETHLIKQYSPPFNVRLKDDKKYPYLKISTEHAFPALWVTRNVIADGARYFGPFTQVKDLRRCLKTLRSVFQLRNCSDRRLRQGGRECLQYFIGACTGPCTARVDEQGYRAQVDPLIALLSGRSEAVFATMRQRMHLAAADLRFEESARLRDGIATLELLVQEQRMTPPVESDVLVIGLAGAGRRACVVLLQVSAGKVVGKSHRFLTGTEGRSGNELLRAFLLVEFVASPRVPSRIACAVPPAERVAVEQALASRVGHPVRIQSARRGELRGILEAAEQNARLLLEEEALISAAKTHRVAQAVFALQEAMRLERPPYRIEGYDISNFQGSHPVASRVVFQDGKPLKAAYRRLRMNHIEGPDDFAMMAEVVRRRLVKLGTPGDVAPDLILVDGGVGQVGAAFDVLQEMGLSHLALAGLAKREEEIVLPQGGQPLRLPRGSIALQLLQRVRDEAHRFAVSYHRTLRAKAQKVSELDQVRGIGPTRRRALLRRYGSIARLRTVPQSELASLPGIGPTLAGAILAALAGGTPEPAREEGDANRD